MAQEPVFQHSCLQPFIDHPADDTIRDSSVKKRTQVGVRNRPEGRHHRLPISRIQVCKAQSPLPCCPSAVLSSRRLPSLDRVPLSAVRRRHQYYEGATTPTRRITGHLFGSLPVPTRFLHALSRSTYFNGREIFLIDGLPENTSRDSVETMGSGTGKWQAR